MKTNMLMQSYIFKKQPQILVFCSNTDKNKYWTLVGVHKP